MSREENAHPLEMVSAFADGELSPQEVAVLQAHLRGCPDCRQALHDFRRLGAAVGEETVPAPPAATAATIRRRIEAGAGPGRAQKEVAFWRSPFPLATAAGLALVTVAYLGWRREVPNRAPAKSDMVASQALESPALPDADGSLVGARDDNRQGVKPESSQGPGQAADPLVGQRSLRPRDEKKAASGYLDGRDDSAGQAGGYADAGSDRLRETVEIADAQLHDDSLERKNEPLAAAPQSPAPAAASKLEKSRVARETALPADSPRAKQSAKVAGKDSAVAGGVLAGAPAGAAASRAAADTIPTAVLSDDARSLAYEGPDFSATFSEDGLITVIARGYACSVSVPPLSSATPAGRPKPAAVEDLASLFATALSKEFFATPAKLTDSESSEGARRSSSLSSLTIRDSEGDPLHGVSFAEPLENAAPEVVRSLRQGMQRLFSVRYRADLEARCGPLPPILAPAP